MKISKLIIKFRDNMKIELVDAMVPILAIFFLGAYIKLGAAAFLYVVILLILAEAFAVFWERRKNTREVKETESLP